MALAKINQEIGQHLIHHSDRGHRGNGIQYCSNDYIQALKDYNIQISMTENSDPLENPIAERVNGILKEEYLCNVQIDSLPHAYKVCKMP